MEESAEPRLCPRCGESVKPVPIVYGLPGPEMIEQAERRQIRLGGCVVGDESPDYACPACEAPLPYVNEERDRPKPSPFPSPAWFDWFLGPISDEERERLAARVREMNRRALEEKRALPGGIQMWVRSPRVPRPDPDRE